ncbi:MAG: heavy metal-binding domain-containing protein [Myxococcota bacterium]
MKTRTKVKIATIGAFLGACSAGPLPVSQSLRDPASPAAPEGTNPLVASAGAPKRETERPQGEHPPSDHDHGAHGHGDHDHGTPPASMRSAPTPAGNEGAPATEGLTYVCPMHPEVTSNAPGVCPKCGMKLVPKK